MLADGVHLQAPAPGPGSDSLAALLEPVSLMLRPFPKQPLDGAVAPPCACFHLQPLSWVAVVSQAPDSALAAGGAQSPRPACLPIQPEHKCSASFSCNEGSLGHWYCVAVSPQFPQQLLRCPRVLKSCFLCYLYLSLTW